MTAMHQCREVHNKAEESLQCEDHDDPVIVELWNVVSAQNELLCALAECLHSHLPGPNQMPANASDIQRR
ncbi:hypothetical protein [Enterobacter mori]|uniref:hypothetical protein n=1 Tax=Enterobacter mori TaxID=539813 RepID=UPI003B83BBC5